MYSLILADDVVDEIDKMADAEGTNRSYLINRILADYVGIDTPEKTITDIFKRIENIFGGESDTINYRNHDNTLSIKSALKYKYRPTLRYEVELYRSPTGAIGELNVNFRTQSPELLTKLTEFFRSVAKNGRALRNVALQKRQDFIFSRRKQVDPFAVYSFGQTL